MVDGKSGLTRRHFIGGAAVGLGLTMASGDRSAAAEAPVAVPRGDRLPREVWVASVSQNGMTAETPQQMSARMLARMEEIVPLAPDIICLPEVFPFVNLSGGRSAVKDAAEVPIGPIARPFADFARRHRCYVVCPIYTKENGRCYNAAVFIDRDGKMLGEYRKIHPTIGEIEMGVAPGPLEPPVFKTDFGVVGAQICFDIEWADGWRKLRAAGAELVFWPSAFGGGSMVNTKAWVNKVAVVSSTRKGTTKICDVTGEALSQTGHFASWVCAPINLEKAFLHTWPYCNRFRDIESKYGRKVRIHTFHEEEWSIIESRSAEVRIADVLKEFELQTHEEHIQAADAAQQEWRRKTRHAPA